MLTINPITNVNNTPNNKVSFGRGVQTNFGISAPSPKTNMVEGGFLTGFLGTVKADLGTINSRAKSIEKGLNETKLNFFA